MANETGEGQKRNGTQPNNSCMPRENEFSSPPGFQFSQRFSCPGTLGGHQTLTTPPGQRVPDPFGSPAGPGHDGPCFGPQATRHPAVPRHPGVLRHAGRVFKPCSPSGRSRLLGRCVRPPGTPNFKEFLFSAWLNPTTKFQIKIQKAVGANTLKHPWSPSLTPSESGLNLTWHRRLRLGPISEMKWVRGTPFRNP